METGEILIKTELKIFYFLWLLFIQHVATMYKLQDFFFFKETYTQKCIGSGGTEKMFATVSTKLLLLAAICRTSLSGYYFLLVQGLPSNIFKTTWYSEPVK